MSSTENNKIEKSKANNRVEMVTEDRTKYFGDTKSDRVPLKEEKIESIKNTPKMSVNNPLTLNKRIIDDYDYDDEDKSEASGNGKGSGKIGVFLLIALLLLLIGGGIFYFKDRINLNFNNKTTPKDEKGLTYIATIILVIIIIAFAIGVILYIQQQYRNEESETIKTNMLAIQGKAKIGKQITIATIQSLPKQIEQVQNQFGTILVDESHHIPEPMCAHSCRWWLSRS